jgi:hypothetical protein
MPRLIKQEPAERITPVLADNDVNETLFLQDYSQANCDDLSAGLDADLASTGFSGFREVEP